MLSVTFSTVSVPPYFCGHDAKTSPLGSTRLITQSFPLAMICMRPNQIWFIFQSSALCPVEVAREVIRYAKHSAICGHVGEAGARDAGHGGGYRRGVCRCVCGVGVGAGCVALVGVDTMGQFVRRGRE